MNKIERIYELLDILKRHKYPISAQAIREQLECSHATFKRTLKKARHEFNAPIAYDARHNGYYIDNSGTGNCELPGLWFSVSELHALLTINELLAQLGSGLLGAELKPFRDRIDALLDANDVGSHELIRRVRVSGIGIRPCDNTTFRKAADATLKRRRMQIEYQDRRQNRWTKRTISPQRLLYYRDNWYLHCWCHLRDALRLFALERIRSVTILEDDALDLPGEQLDHAHASAYGIFGGEAVHTAVLHFTPNRSRWVADERYHPNQQGRFLEDGSYELRLPYSDPRELLLDILRHGPDVEVMEPPELRSQIRVLLVNTLKKYE